MEHLSEDTIQRGATQLLRSYYKIYPRHQSEQGEIVSRWGVRDANGIVIDGWIEFVRESGKKFVATFEVSSATNIGEVKYTLNYHRLLWDTAALSAIASTLLMGAFSRTDSLAVNTIGVFGSILLFFMTAVVSGGLCYLVLKGLSRYRYIYAIAQFKKYHADEQWVALGQDVFPNSNDPSWLELYKQCRDNGFGIMIVDRDMNHFMALAPSREPVHRERPGVVPQVSDQVDNLTKNLLRYQQRQPYVWQMGVVFLSFLMTFGVFYRQHQARPVLEASADYTDALKSQANRMTAEPNVYVEPTPAASVAANTKSYPPTPTAPPPPSKDMGEMVGMLTTTQEGIVEYPCDRVNFNLAGSTWYVVLDRECQDFSEASRRVKELNALGFMGNCLSLQCFNPELRGYIVYHKTVFSDRREANTFANTVFAALKQKGIVSNIKDLNIFMLEGK